MAQIPEQRSQRPGRIAQVSAGILVFAALMGVRYVVHGTWLRAGLAACALGLLSWALLAGSRK